MFCMLLDSIFDLHKQIDREPLNQEPESFDSHPYSPKKPKLRGRIPMLLFFLFFFFFLFVSSHRIFFRIFFIVRSFLFRSLYAYMCWFLFPFLLFFISFWSSWLYCCQLLNYNYKQDETQFSQFASNTCFRMNEKIALHCDYGIRKSLFLLQIFISCFVVVPLLSFLSFYISTVQRCTWRWLKTETRMNLSNQKPNTHTHTHTHTNEPYKWKHRWKKPFQRSNDCFCYFLLLLFLYHC